MNKIEQMFYDALIDINSIEDILVYEIQIQPVIGIYKPDFIVECSIIEIDGHNSHKDKEQREYDYIRERYFLKKGFNTIRFMGTEVFLDAKKCAQEAIKISQELVNKEIKLYNLGYSNGFEKGGK